MAYFAEINESNTVLRVVVCDSLEWLTEHLGGRWVETQIDDEVEQYAGIGYGIDGDSQAKFALPWRQPVPGGDEESDMGYSAGSHVFHEGTIWQSRVASNVWEPGVFGWFDALSEVPRWRQPAGAGDEWPLNAEVMHSGKHWKSNHAANVWEPGADGIGPSIWEDITSHDTPEGQIADWNPWDGNNANLYQIGNEVMHNGTHWRATVGNNHWEPGVFGWEVVQ